MLRRRSLVAAAVATAAGFAWFGPASAQSWRTMTSARQVWDTQPMQVEVGYGAGELTIRPAEAPLLYQMEIRYDAETHEPRIEFDQDSRSLGLGLRSTDDDRRRRNRRDGASATIALSREVPIDLDLEFGVGEADIELGGMSLQNLEISTGASESRIRFSEPNRIAAELISIQAGAADLEVLGLGNLRANRVEFEGGVGATVLDFSGATDDMTASVEIGVGAVTLRLPRSHGIQLNRNSFLTSFDANGLQSRGNSYYSANWGSTERQLTIDVSAALGSIEIEWVD